MKNAYFPFCCSVASRNLIQTRYMFSNSKCRWCVENSQSGSSQSLLLIANKMSKKRLESNFERFLLFLKSTYLGVASRAEAQGNDIRSLALSPNIHKTAGVQLLWFLQSVKRYIGTGELSRNIGAKNKTFEQTK